MWRNSLVIQRFFMRRGLVNRQYNWYTLFDYLYRFYLRFKFHYIYKTGVLKVKYVPLRVQYKTRLKFLKTILKINNQVQFKTIQIKPLFDSLTRIKNNIFRSLLK